VGFEPRIPAFEGAKTVLDSDRAATVVVGGGGGGGGGGAVLSP
jgi:hypothetical protein